MPHSAQGDRAELIMPCRFEPTSVGSSLGPTALRLLRIQTVELRGQPANHVKHFLERACLIQNQRQPCQVESLPRVPCSAPTRSERQNFDLRESPPLAPDTDTLLQRCTPSRTEPLQFHESRHACHGTRTAHGTNRLSKGPDPLSFRARRPVELQHAIRRPRWRRPGHGDCRASNLAVRACQRPI